MFGVTANNQIGIEEKENLLEVTKISTQSTKTNQQFLRLFLRISVSLNIFLTLFGLFALTYKQKAVAEASYENGFASDLEPIKSEIELVVKTFSGGVHLNGTGSFVIDQGGHEYVGIPKPAVDKAWDMLLEGLNLDFDIEEVELADSTFQWPESGLLFSGLDVFHSLHCLNRLRQAMYPNYYSDIFDRPTNPSRNDHIDHCINHIRQSLQCHADLTPMEWRLDGSKIILKTDTRHTCRNFDKIHAWATSKRTKFESIKSWLNGSLIIVD